MAAICPCVRVREVALAPKVRLLVPHGREHFRGILGP